MNQQNFSNDENFYAPPPPSEQGPQNSLALASMIVGIVSLVLFSCCWPFVAVLAIVGIVLACVSKQGGPMDTKAKTGLICSIITLVLSVLTLIAFVAFMFFSMSNAF